MSFPGTCVVLSAYDLTLDFFVKTRLASSHHNTDLQAAQHLFLNIV